MGAAKIKCLVWDLDNTLWDGTLLEDPIVRLRTEARGVISELDARGILHSIASKNDFEPAMSRVRDFGLDDYFLYPQIGWRPKSDSIRTIAQSLNIGLDAIAFMDDQPFEREEVRHSLAEVACYDASSLSALPQLGEFQPLFVSEDSRRRRKMYQEDIRRQDEESSFSGPKESFLKTLGMKLRIALAREEDLARAEELTVRTHQLNTTGKTYGYEELAHFCHSDRHRLLVVMLEDKHGSYGTVGLTLLECEPRSWRIKLLLMSCRVMSRGVGGVILTYLRNTAKERGKELLADWIPNERNRMMLVTYRFAGFQDFQKEGERQLLRNMLEKIPPYPDYFDLSHPDPRELV